MISFGSITVICDHCNNGPGDRYAAMSTADLIDGRIHVHLPNGWTQSPTDEMFCPRCSETRAYKKLRDAPIPDPANDPEPLKATKERRMRWMKKAIREDLADTGYGHDIDEDAEDAKDLIKYMKILQEENAPDFMGHFGDKCIPIEVRVRKQHVEIQWPGDGMSLTLRHADLKIVEAPPFIDSRVIEWVQGCLSTMTPKEVADREELLAQ